MKTKCPAVLHLLRHQLDGDGEHDGGVLLRGDGGEGLEVAELQRSGRLGDDVTSLLQSPAGLLLSLGRNHLSIIVNIMHVPVSYKL